ncbi:hypothetical protein WM32_09500 [Burkholderia ubonensis]|uniref:Thioesterase domain-containing protein n=1 Tax=Burkholderia ubonensis TaxID=101571 RepID=A0A119Y817_9BURK|nr:hypothetical protein WJ33_22650 [Burkholderia ubonensis]KWO88025.1 hypothetical protein WM32_09500 [Burkholderia ubonensis]OJB21325.1 hypothetical protein BGV54_17835 [Burkholderia ubonensis]
MRVVSRAATVARAPRLRIFCIPFLGGLGSVFSGWVRHQPEEIELQALQLPGRPPRHAEAAHSLYPELVDALRDALLPRLDAPYAIRLVFHTI